MPRQWKLTGAFNVEGLKMTARRTNGATQVDRTITMSGLKLVLGAADVDCILEHIKTEIQAIDAGEFDDLDYSLDNDTGIVSWFLGAGQTGTFTWTGGANTAQAVRDWLRYDDQDPTPLTDVANPGNQCHRFGFYPSRTAIVDLEVEVPQGIQGIADDGSHQTLTTPRLRERRLQFRYDGFPRKLVPGDFATPGEYEQLIDFMDLASTGARVRAYPDRTIDAAFVRLTEPYGYHVLVLRRVSWGWSPEPIRANNYARFRSPVLSWGVHV